MSTLKTKKVQLGDNADPSKNFLIEVPAVADGTLSIKRQDGTNVLSIAANGSLDLSGYFSSGEYTPVLSGLTTAGVGTYTNQTGYWTKIGNLVWISARVDWTAHTGTGIMRLSIPFSGMSGTMAPLSTYANGLNAGAANVPLAVVVGTGGTSTGIQLYGVSDSGGSVTIPNMDTTGSLIVSGFYRTNE